MRKSKDMGGTLHFGVGTPWRCYVYYDPHSGFYALAIDDDGNLVDTARDVVTTSAVFNILLRKLAKYHEDKMAEAMAGEADDSPL